LSRSGRCRIRAFDLHNPDCKLPGAVPDLADVSCGWHGAESPSLPPQCVGCGLPWMPNVPVAARAHPCHSCRKGLQSKEMDPRDEMEPNQLETLAQVFCEQLMACLDECARGRRGLFSDVELLGEDESSAWPEAVRLRELALAMQGLLTQQEERNALCDEFLDLCSIHGESNPGERKLARTFLERIERGEVGAQAEGEKKPW